MKSAAILILAVISFFGSGTMIPSAANAQKLVITSPLNGAVLPTQQQAIIEAEFVPPVECSGARRGGARRQSFPHRRRRSSIYFLTGPAKRSVERL